MEGPDFPLPRLPRRFFVNGLQSMDGVDIRHVFHRRPLVMKSVPKFMQGALRGGLRALMEEIRAARLARVFSARFVVGRHFCCCHVSCFTSHHVAD